MRDTQQAAREASLLAYLTDLRLRLLAIAGRLRADLPALQAAGLEVVGMRLALDAVGAEPSEGVCVCEEYGCQYADLPRVMPLHLTYSQRQRWLAETRNPVERRPLVRYWHGGPHHYLRREVWELTQVAGGECLRRYEAELDEIDVDDAIHIERSGETRDEMCTRYERDGEE